jgi:hypothetical protein
MRVYERVYISWCVFRRVFLCMCVCVCVHVCVHVCVCLTTFGRDTTPLVVLPLIVRYHHDVVFFVSLYNDVLAGYHEVNGTPLNTHAGIRPTRVGVLVFVGVYTLMLFPCIHPPPLPPPSRTRASSFSLPSSLFLACVSVARNSNGESPLANEGL